VKTLKIIALVVFTLGVPLALWIGSRFMPAITQTAPPTTMEVLSVLFGAVTIVLGVLAIIIAVLAIWGYHAIKEESSGVASGAAKTAALDYIKSEEVQRKLREESRKIIDEEMIKIREGLALALSQPSQDVQTAATQQESTKKVGKRYSGKRDG
jgi:hypothetical protein